MYTFCSNAQNTEETLQISPEVDLCKDEGGDEDVSEAGDGDEEDNRNLLQLPTTDLASK